MFAGIRTGVTPPRHVLRVAESNTSNSENIGVPVVSPGIRNRIADADSASAFAAAGSGNALLGTSAHATTPREDIDESEGGALSASTPAKDDSDIHYYLSVGSEEAGINSHGASANISDASTTNLDRTVNIKNILQEFARIRAPLARFGPAVLDSSYLHSTSETCVDGVPLPGALRTEDYRTRFAEAFNSEEYRSGRPPAGMTEGKMNPLMNAKKLTYRFSVCDVVRRKYASSTSSLDAEHRHASPGTDGYITKKVVKTGSSPLEREPSEGKGAEWRWRNSSTGSTAAAVAVGGASPPLRIGTNLSSADFDSPLVLPVAPMK